MSDIPNHLLVYFLLHGCTHVQRHPNGNIYIGYIDKWNALAEKHSWMGRRNIDSHAFVNVFCINFENAGTEFELTTMRDSIERLESMGEQPVLLPELVGSCHD